MGLSKRDNHVLKLVHPGGFVELHFKPVMAAEVMKKNPRHFVTRPDIFRFPWIVVSQESILRPGSVFFVVPSQTIRHLLKSKTAAATTANDTDQSSVEQDCHCHTGSKISNSKKNQCFNKQSSSISPSISPLPCMKLRTSRDRKGKKQKQKKESKKAQSFVKERPIYCGEYPSDNGGIEGAWSSSRFGHSQQVTMLKSCLKKDKNESARSRNLNVKFVCQNKDVNNTSVIPWMATSQ